MDSRGPDQLENGLAEIRSALGHVRPSVFLTSRLQARSTASSGPPVARGQRRRWRFSLAAVLLGLALIGGSQLWVPTNEAPPVRAPRGDRQLVVRQFIPVRIHSVSGGTELRYLASRVVRGENGSVRAVYLLSNRRN